MGAVALKHQGRKIQDLRVCDLNDGYAINGWEAEPYEDFSGIVDEFRNPKRNPNLIARYNKPLCVAVKVRQQIVESHQPVTVDFYTINELNLTGPHTLAVSGSDPNGQLVFSKTFSVDLKGGDVFSQLAAEG